MYKLDMHTWVHTESLRIDFPHMYITTAAELSLRGNKTGVLLSHHQSHQTVCYVHTNTHTTVQVKDAVIYTVYSATSMCLYLYLIILKLCIYFVLSTHHNDAQGGILGAGTNPQWWHSFTEHFGFFQLIVDDHHIYATGGNVGVSQSGFDISHFNRKPEGKGIRWNGYIEDGVPNEGYDQIAFWELPV